MSADKPVLDPLEQGLSAGDLAVITRLWPHVRQHRRRLGFALALLPLITGAAVSETYLLKQALDLAIVPAVPRASLALLLTAFLGLLAVEAVLRFAHGWLLQTTGQRIVHDLRVSLLSHLQRAPMPYFDENPVGRLLTRATTDLEAIGELFASGAISAIGDVITVCGVGAMMFWLDAHLALVVICFAPLLALTVVQFRRRVKQAYETARARFARMTAYLAEALAGLEVLKVTVQEARAAGEYADINREYRDAYWWSNFYEAALYSAVELFGSTTVACLLWVAGGRILAGRTTFGTLVAFLRCVEDLFTPLRDSSAKFAVLQSAVVAADRILAVLAVDPEDITQRETPPAGADRGRIELQDVRFGYREGHEVLAGVSFRVAPGERIAIVGATGAGKTTLVKLLCRLYAIRSGTARLDGRALDDYPLSELRRRVAYLPQDCYLFSGTALENVSLGRPDADRAAIEAAARQVGADDVIRRLPDGWDTVLSERGTNLSAGERQLVAFARVVLLDPSVLVLDEATASVDTFAEEQVQRSLEKIMKGRTTLIIAHRLATIRAVDRILVFAEGRLAEEGRHDALLERGGLYARLHALQFGAVARRIAT